MLISQKVSDFVGGGFWQVSSGLLCLSLIAFFIHWWYQWRALSHVPGPFWASITKLWMLRQSLKNRQPDAFKDANDKYGSLVRVGPNEVITNDPDVMRRMMAVRSKYTRGHFYKAMRFDPTRDNLLSMRDDVAHAQLRSKMAFGYSGKENESMEGSLDAQVANFVNLIETKYLSSKDCYRPVEFSEKVSFFTLDVISDLAFGKAFGYLSTDTDVFDYNKMIKAAIPVMLAIADIPTLAEILQSRFFRSLLPSEADKIGFGAFIGVAKRLVAERFLPGSKPRRDMLGSFIRHGLTQDEVSGEALLQIVAGSDTSAGGIRSMMLNVVTNPMLYRNLQKEIDDGIQTGKISSPITDAEARGLPYLQAVIKEGLRIMPPASGSMFKQVPPEGDVIGGKFLPGGTQIGGSPLGIQRSKHIFGPDADLFRPERWFEGDAEKLVRMNTTVDLCFHYGKWQCLGKSVVLMEFNKILVELFRRFDFRVCRPDKPTTLYNAVSSRTCEDIPKARVEAKNNVKGIWIMEDFWLRIETRESL